MKFSNLKIQNMLILGFGFIVVFMFIAGISTLLSVSRFADVSENMYRHPLTVSNAVRDIEINILTMQRTMKDVVSIESIEELEEYASLIDSSELIIMDKFELVNKRFLGDQALVQMAYESFIDWKPKRDIVFQLMMEGEVLQAAIITKTEGAEHIETLLSKTVKMIEYAEMKAESFYNEGKEIRDSAFNNVIIFYTMVILVSIGISIFITGSITRPINRIIERINNLSSTESQSEIKVKGVHHFVVLDNSISELEKQYKVLAEEILHRKEIQKELETYQSHLEGEVSQRTEELNETRVLLSNAFDGAAIGMVLVNTNGKFFWSNPAFREIVGYTDSELKNFTFNDITYPEDRDVGSDILKSILNGEKNKSEFTKRYIHKSGKVVFIKIITSLIKDPSGVPSHFFTQAQDITEQKESERKILEYSENLEEMVKERTKVIEEKSKSVRESQKALTYLLEDVNDSRAELEAAYHKLELANKELESFSYSVSHDLRAPLRAIDGFSRMLFDNYGENFDEEGRRLFETIRNNTKKMGQLIDDLLAFSRLGRKKIDKSKINMSELARDIASEIKLLEKEREIKIHIENLPEAFGDISLLRQVMFNLLSNAVKFTKENKNAFINFGYEEKEDETIFYVEDNGVGFNMQYAHKLFNVFQRLHSEQEFEGTGVGLAIVHRVITRHGGKIWAEAEIKKGAKFYFSLPKLDGPNEA